MNVVLLSIGNEILSGDTVNTNVSWIGKTLTELGCNVQSQVTVPDNRDSILLALESIFKSNPDLVITTGGLGPTEDDITRQVIFDYVGTEHVFDESYWKKLKRRFERYGYDIPESNRSQAITPTKGDIIPNPVGSARGFQFMIDSTLLIILPGVPMEMKSMINKSVIPYIVDQNITVPNIKLLRTTGIPESVLIEKIEPATKNNEHCRIGYYPSYYGVDIRITSDQKNSLRKLTTEISDILGYSVYTTDKIDIAEVIINLALQKDATFATAESCTGGLIGHRITGVSGSSKSFVGGITAYSNNVKKLGLGVRKNTLKKYGAVSNETAEEMAENVLLKFQANYGLSVTGIAGPDGGSDYKPVGLVYIGLAKKNSTMVKKLQFGTDRTRNKLRASQAALDILRLELIHA